MCIMQTLPLQRFPIKLVSEFTLGIVGCALLVIICANISARNGVITRMKQQERVAAGRSWTWLSSEDILIRKDAFFDARDRAAPAIVINMLKNDQKRILPHLYAKVVYNTSVNEPLCVPLYHFQRSGHYKFPSIKDEPPSYYVNHLWKTYGGQLLRIPPQHVQITSDHKCVGGLSQPLLIHNSTQHRNLTERLKFGVCLHQPLFGNVRTQDIIDWIMIHRIMGVEIIYIYLENEPNGFIRTVKPLVDEGFVKIIDWSLGVETMNYGQRAVINDCLYRSMSEVEYLALYDFDEIFVPRKHLKWSDFFKDIGKQINLADYAGFSFKVRQWHDSNVPLITDNKLPCSNVTVPVYLKRAFITETSNMHRSLGKVIVRTDAVYSCSVHGILSHTPKTKVYSVEQKFGQVHHYRHHEHPYTRLTYDPIMKKYADQVLNKLCRFAQ